MSHRALDSRAFIGYARAALAVIDDPVEPERRRVFGILKSNLTGPKPSLHYYISDPAVTGDFERDPRIIWTATSDLSVRNAVPATKPSASEEAAEFLEEILKNGPVNVREIRFEAEEQGVAWRTVEREKARIGALAKQRGVKGVMGPESYWMLPEHQHLFRQTSDSPGGVSQLQLENLSHEVKENDNTAV